MRTFYLGALALYGALVAASPAAAINVVPGPVATQQDYTFTGNCNDCTNSQGVLTLQGYRPGTGQQITADNFVSFTYSSSIFDPATTITPDSGDILISGDLENLPGQNDFSLEVYSTDTFLYDQEQTFVFRSSSDGFFCVGYECNPSLDIGTSHTWDAVDTTGGVPEPMTWALLLGGFGMIGYQLRAVRRIALA